MTMKRTKEGLEGFGDPDLARRQEEIQKEFQARHPGIDDIPLEGRLPQVKGVQSGETILTPLSPETQQLVEQMKRDGYAVYETTGKTPAAVRNEGMKFWYLDSKLEDLAVAPALLAFKKAPSQIFLPGSHDIPHDKQVNLLPQEQVKVDRAYDGAGLVVREGKLPEWTELAWRHFKTTNVRIFGRDYGYNSTWTDTYKSEQPGAGRARFGYWDGTDSAYAFLWRPGRVNPRLGLAPLVEIPRK